MVTKELLLEASRALAEEEYEEALKLYTKVLESEPSNESCLTLLAQVYIKLQKYEDALEMASKAINLNSLNNATFLKKGIAEYHLNNYASAKDSFNKGLQLKADDAKLKDWLQKCTKMLPDQTPSPASSSPSTTSSLPSSSSTPAPTEETSTENAFIPKLSEDPKKTRYDWYQTDTHVIVTLLIKNVTSDKFKYNLTDKSLSCTVELPTDSTYSLELDLQHHISPAQSTIKIFSTKVEVKMKKEEGLRWTALEGTDDAAPKTADGTSKKYPSSKPHCKDWDKLAGDIKDDKEEGDAALNQLFQQIYSDGTDETRKAMMKSFTESGGTVLSTNWKEIGDKKVDVKPPDGMEYKKWQF